MQGKAPAAFPYKAVIKGLGIIMSLVLLGFLVRSMQSGGVLDAHWIDTQVSHRGWQGAALFFAVGGVFTAIGWPRQIVSFLGGYAFGFAAGTFWALLASVLGCAMAFYYARWLGRGLIRRKFPGRVRHLDDFVHEHPFSMTLLIRLLPVGSNLVTNLVAGVSSVRARPFMAGSAAGYVPQTAVFALAGSGVAVDPELRIGLAVVLFVVSSVLGVKLYRRFRHGKGFDETVDRNLGESP
ncbi:MAG TPA: VTT domain-containing protein [Thiobacillaceae bacterium]|nr:VTT domain-containing protein [Thiobacillaceae bacterium]